MSAHDPQTRDNMVTRLVTERFQAGTEDTSVLNSPVPLKQFCDSGTGYKSLTDLLSYTLTYKI